MNIESISKKAQYLRSLKSPSLLFNELNNLSSNIVETIWNKWKPKDLFQQVNLLRFLIADKLIKKEEVTQRTIDEIKVMITNRDISSLYAVPEPYLQNMVKYKDSSLGMFHQWKDPFLLLFPFLYSDEEKQETIDSLNKIGLEIIKSCSITNAKIHPVDFYGSNNYGGDVAWIAIIPKEAPNVQRAYQIFLRIDMDGVSGGIYKGHKLINTKFKEATSPFKNLNEYIKKIGELIPKWNELNAGVDFSLQSDEREFIKRIKKIPEKDLRFYFQTLDIIIEELNIPNEYNLVFSTGSSQLSFQIGKRYCLNLKNDAFSFIAPEGYNIHKADKSYFSGDEKAGYFNNVKSPVVKEHLSAILNAIQVELGRQNQVEPKEYDNSAFREAVFNKDYRANFFDSPMSGNVSTVVTKPNLGFSRDLNKILFGPPGTGKTFSTIAGSISIVAPSFYKLNANDPFALQNQFNSLLIKDLDSDQGQIAFCTFHQSFSYEDFVEGIKPVSSESSEANLKYEIVNGIFKKMCRLAEANLKAIQFSKGNHAILTNNEMQAAIFYKISLGDYTREEDKEIYEYCIQNDVISIGFGGKNDFTGKNEQEIEKLVAKSNLEPFATEAILRFKDGLKKENYVLVSKGNSFVRALGKVVGDYEYNPDSEIIHRHFRKVKWIFKDVDIPISEIYTKKLSQQTIYKLKNNFIIPSFFINNPKNGTTKKEIKNYVLIIDEINRGNVSAIFGELITLIEANKRTGLPEALEAILPYSKERFSVPPNLHILGTMNTADRSVEALDAALRRRFAFEEMPPKYDLKELNRYAGKHLLKEILGTLNIRLEKLLDKDHKIGHSYFMFPEDSDTVTALMESFYKNIIPLLQEYFFGDYGKIGLVLGKGFVTIQDQKEKIFCAFDYDGADMLLEKPVYSIVDYRKPSSTLPDGMTFTSAMDTLMENRI